MSIRRINSTGRKKILREDALILLTPDPDGVLTFDAALTFADYELPGDALVFVEAYRQTTFMRFAHGTVAAPTPPPDRRLTEFGTSDGLLFRVKVTSAGDRAGVLLAEADRVPVSDDHEHPDNRIPLLPPAPADLGHENWRVDFSGQDGPLLLVNIHVGDWKAVAASPVFRSLVYPAAMREVLKQIVFIDETDDNDDAESWQSRWLAFAGSLGAGEPPASNADENDKINWIDDAVEAFARRHQFLDHFRAFFGQEEPG